MRGAAAAPHIRVSRHSTVHCGIENHRAAEGARERAPLVRGLKTLIEVSLLELHNEIKKQAVEDALADEEKMFEIINADVNQSL